MENSFAMKSSSPQTLEFPETNGAGRKRYKVLHLATYAVPHVGGVEHHMHTLCKALAEHMDVSELGGGGPRLRSAKQIIDGISVTQLATPFTIRSATICPEIPLAIWSSKADLVHLHMPNPFGAVAYLGSGHRGPMIVTWHFDVVRQRAMNQVFKHLFNRVLDRASAVVTTSPNLIRSSERLRTRSDRVRVIPYGIDYTSLSRPCGAEVEKLRQRYGQRILLGVGRLIYYKGWRYILSAMPRIDANLLIVGEGPLREELERQVQAEGIADKVHFLGELTDLAALYQACDVFVFPSIKGEAFGIVQIEAMAAGKPVVNTNLESGVPFVSRHEDSGLTVPPHDSESLVQAINRLLDDPALRQRFGMRGRTRVQSEFSIAAMKRATLKLYGEVLSDDSLADQIS
jgi:glycosyltransferase involved in cell wall biosynthesis